MAEESFTPLGIHTPPRPTTRLNRKTLAAGLGLLAAVVMLVIGQVGGKRQAAHAKADDPVAPSTSAPLPDFLAIGPKGYQELARQEAKEAASKEPARHAPAPPESPAVPPEEKPRAAEPPAAAKRPARETGPRQAAARTPQKPREPARWFAAEGKAAVAEPPFPVTEEEVKEKVAQAVTGQRGAGLFPQASWAIPEDPTKVIYRDQVINGVTKHHIHSDLPGEVHILVNEELQDRFGQRRVLLPQYTVLVGRQEGKVDFGQGRLGIVIENAILPDGAVIGFGKARAADAQGASGVPGEVNNHWGKVGIAAVLTALLSVGSQAAAGDPRGFQLDLTQQFARDAGQSFNQTGQQIVRRSLDVRPTVTVKSGEPVTVHLGENVNLQTPPVVVAR